MPQQPVGLDVKLSQPNLRPVSPQNKLFFLFRLIANSEQLYVNIHILFENMENLLSNQPIRKQYSNFLNCHWPAIEFLYFGTSAIFTSAVSGSVAPNVLNGILCKFKNLTLYLRR